MHRAATFVILLGCLLVAPHTIMAQSGDTFNLAQEGITVQPEFPKPGDIVTLQFESYGANTGGATLTWRVNGQTIADATNRRQATMVAGALGTRDIIEVVIQQQDGVSRSIQTAVVPGYLDIVIEAQTHVPHFYRGRSLPSFGSPVVATALLHTGANSPTDLVYTWRLNQKVLEFGPIRGRNSVTFDATWGREMLLSVQVAQPDGTVLGRKAISVPVASPEMHFYEVNGLYGTIPLAIKDRLLMIGSTATIIAEPYYLNSRVFNAPSSYRWRVDSEEVTSRSNPYQVTIQKTGDSGTSRLQFEVLDTMTVQQNARGSIQVQY